MKYPDASLPDRLTFPPLEIQHAAMTKRRWRERMLQLEDFHLQTLDELEEHYAITDYIIGARTKVQEIGGEEGAMEERLIGTLWADEFSTLTSNKRIVLPDVLEILCVATDCHYTGAAEWWLMDQLKIDVERSTTLTHLAIRSLLGTREWWSDLAERHGFVPKDVKNKEVVWQWPASDEGVLWDTLG